MQSQRVARILEGFGRTRLTRALLVPGSEADIADAVRGLVARCDVVLVTDSSGLAFAAAGAQGLGNSLSPFPVPARDNALVTDGVYAMVRRRLPCAALQALRPVTTIPRN